MSNARQVIYLAVVLLALPRPASGQYGRIVGTVLDASDSPFAGANVLLRGTTLGTASNRDGRFEFAKVPAGAHEIVCSFVGYKPTSVAVFVSDRGAIDVKCTLVESLIESQGIVVTASRRPQLASDVTASLGVIPASFLAARGARTLDSALKNESGLQIQGNQVNIRGSGGFAYNTGSRVLMLVDGMPLLSPDTDGIPFESFPVGMIQQIEVLKGSGSALYGSGALGGVINIISADPGETSETRVSASVGAYQPFRFQSWKAQFPGGQRPRFSTDVNISHSQNITRRLGGWISVGARTDEGYLNANATTAASVFSKLSVGVGHRSDLSLLLGFLTRRRESFLFWNGLRDPLNPGSIAISRSDDPTGSSKNHTTTITLLPQLRSSIGSRTIATTRARLYGVLIQPVDVAGRAKPLRDGTVGFRVGAESQFTSMIGIGQFTYGATADANLTPSSFFLTADGSEAGRQPEAALYVQYETTPIPRVSFVGGLRADQYWINAGNRAGSISPKLAASFTVSSSATLRASIGTGFRSPSVAERYTNDQSFFPIFRNLDLLPETSRSVETGLHAEWDRDQTRLFVDAALFYSRLDDLIEPRFVQTTLEDGTRLLGFQFVNITSGRVRGCEIDASMAISKLWVIRTGYTILSTRDSETRRPLAYRPKHLLVSGIEFAPRSMQIGLDLRLATAPETVDSDFSRFVPDAAVMAPTRVVDLHAERTFNVITLRLVVNNAFNYYYLERAALLGAPRQFVVEASARF
ncbi:MAG: TonB-dependent receptor [Rhodothermales bacterium]